MEDFPEEKQRKRLRKKESEDINERPVHQQKLEDKPPKDVKPKTVTIPKPHVDAIVWIHFPSKETLTQLLKCLKNSKFQPKEKGKLSSNDSPIFEIVIPDATKEFSGLRVQMTDKANCCVIVANLNAQIFYSDQHDVQSVKTFKLQTNTLSSAIEAIDASHSLVFYRVKDDANISIVATTPCNSTYFNLVTLNIEDQELEDFDKIKEGLQNVYDHTIEFTLNEFQQIAKYAQNVQSEKIRIVLAQVKKDPQQSYLIIQIEHENNFFEKCYHSFFEKNDKGTRVVFKNTLALTSVKKASKNELDIVFNECFASDFVHMMVAHLSTNQISLQLHQEQPLTLRSTLGDDQSQITFALASKEAGTNDVFKSKIFP